jgi:exodeoxyribonuclease V gamma subunit
VVHLYSADRAEPLARKLAEVLAEDPLDPMQAEWLAVPTAGMRRWLTLELARYLGASGPGTGDGIAANFTAVLPGALRNTVLEAGSPDDVDPWQLDRMVWQLLDVYDELADGGGEPAFTGLAGGASRFTRARTVADLFDRYHLHRPGMVRAWADQRPVDGNQDLIAPHLSWQPRVWGHLRHRIASASPPERFPGILEAVRRDELKLDLPERLLLFGFTSLPGPEFLDLLEALATHRDVHLFMMGPTRFDGAQLLDGWGLPAAGRPRLRIDDATDNGIEPMLLRTWGVSARETALLLADAARRGLPDPTWIPGPPAVSEPGSMLTRLQAGIRGQVTSEEAPVDPGDRSIQFHACFGQSREVEVMRDALLHVLAADETLTEEDILVVCPGLERFAPMVEAVFGSHADEFPTSDNPGGPPRLRYRIADRSIRNVNPVLGGVLQIVELISGRFEVAPVMDFISSAPVRERFAFDDDALGTIVEWVTTTNVRWGLDTSHRATFDMPTGVTGNTWQAAVDRLLVGAATLDDELDLAVGGIAPSAVDGGDAETLGSFAAVLGRLAGLAEWARSGRHPLGEWLDVLDESCRRLMAVPDAASWQFDALTRVTEELRSASGASAPATGHRVDLQDVRRLLGGKLESEAGRPDFFRGGVTVTSMTPLRGVPYRVVCLLGLDQEFIGAPASDAADLVAASPQVGDPDRRIEARQAFLDAVLAAGDVLLVVRDGHDVRSSQSVPRVVPAAELFDAVLALVPPAERDELAGRLEVAHPRHAFDEDCLTGGALVSDLVWSFDPADVERARARRAEAPEGDTRAESSIPGTPTEVIDLAELRNFLLDPVNAFATAALHLSLPRDAEEIDVVLPVELGPLDEAALGRRLLAARRSGTSDDAWLAFERQVGSLPPGALERKVTDVIVPGVQSLIDESTRRGVRSTDPVHQDIEVTLPDGTRIVGAVGLRLSEPTPGPAQVRYARPKPAHTLEAWLDLMALSASDPDRRWRSVAISRGERDEPFEAVDLVVRGPESERAAVARATLGLVVSWYRAGMCQPIPLFPTFSKTVADGDPDPTRWRNFKGWGDSRRPATSFFYGDLTVGELLALEPVDGDPDGSGGRVQRWADTVWDTVTRTSEPTG